MHRRMGLLRRQHIRLRPRHIRRRVAIRNRQGDWTVAGSGLPDAGIVFLSEKGQRRRRALGRDDGGGRIGGLAPKGGTPFTVVANVRAKTLFAEAILVRSSKWMRENGVFTMPWSATATYRRALSPQGVQHARDRVIGSSRGAWRRRDRGQHGGDDMQPLCSAANPKAG